MQIDLDGLQVAYLDESGRIEYFLDVETGEVVEIRSGQPRTDVDRAPSRFLRVPRRTEESEAEDRWAFLGTVEDPAMKRELSGAAEEPARFRALLAHDRMLERAWYSFKNDRASEAIEAWLRGKGML